jgi:pSer/pThr/pTyr-binding forkhead associated (FHA) protein
LEGTPRAFQADLTANFGRRERRGTFFMTMTSGNKETRPTLRGSLEKQLDLVVSRAGFQKGKRKAFLMVSTGPAAGTVFPVAHPSLLIGRSPAADVRIDEQAVSNEHARLEQTDAGFTLLDLGSTNGTYINGQRLADAALLAGGDSVRMGSTTFTFVTRESGLPKGTVRLHNPELAPEVRVARAPESVAMASPPSSSRLTGSLSLTDAVRTVRTYWVYARRYGALIATGAAFGLTLSLIQLWIHPPPGSAWFEMSLASSEPATASSGEGEGPALFAGAESTFRSLPLIKKTLAELGVKSPSDALASDIQAELSFEPVSYNSKVYRGTYQDSSAALAVRFLDQHVRGYVDSELDKLLKVLKTDAEFDREQEQHAFERVAGVRNDLVAFSDEHPEAVPKDAKLPELGRVHLAPGASAERVQQAIVSTRRALHTAYAHIQSRKAQPYLEKVAKAENDIAVAHARGLLEQHPEIKGLRSLQATMRAKANALLALEPSPGEQEQDPQILSLKEDLADLEGRLSQLPASAQPSANGQLEETAQVELSTSRRALQAAPEQASAQSLSQLKIQYGELSRDYERAKTEHEALMKKRETTDRQLERQRTSAEARYDIITPPTAASASLFSAFVKRGGMGVMVGFSLALLAAAYLEVRRILIIRGHI